MNKKNILWIFVFLLLVSNVSAVNYTSSHNLSFTNQGGITVETEGLAIIVYQDMCIEQVNRHVSQTSGSAFSIQNPGRSSNLTNGTFTGANITIASYRLNATNGTSGTRYWFYTRGAGDLYGINPGVTYPINANNPYFNWSGCIINDNGATGLVNNCALAIVSFTWSDCNVVVPTLISFIAPTPANNTVNFINNNTLNITFNVSQTGNVSIGFFNGTWNSFTFGGTNQSSVLLTNLLAGVYQYNATWNNGTANSTTGIRNFTVYNGTIIIFSPNNTNQTNGTMLINYTYNITNNITNISYYNISLLNSDLSFNRTIASIETLGGTTVSQSISANGYVFYFYNATVDHTQVNYINFTIDNAGGSTCSVRATFTYVNGTTATNTSAFLSVGASAQLSNPNPLGPLSKIALSVDRGAITGDCGITFQTFNSTLLITNYLWDVFNETLATGNYYVQVKGFDTRNNTILNVAPFTLVNNALLNITAFSFNATQITTFNITIDGVFYTTSTGLITVPILKGDTYNITIEAPFYNDNGTIYVANTSNRQFINFSLYPYNGINITIYSEANGSILYGNTSLAFASDNGIIFVSSANGTRILTLLSNDSYTVSATLGGYATRYTRVVVPDNSFQNVAIYLNNGTEVLFNFKTNTGTIITGVLFNVYRYVNGTLTLVETRVSDVSGVAQVTLDTTGFYLFTTYKEGFNNYTFTLDPVLFTSYDIVLTATGSGNVVVPSASVTFSPTSFFRFQNVNFNIQFVSQFDSLSTYGYNVTYPGGTVGNTGSNSHGESFNNAFNLGNATIGSQITIFYWYNLSNGVYENATFTYNIVYVGSNRTWATMGNNVNQTTGQDSVTGYYVGERVIIVTLISVIMFGVGWSLGGAMAGLILALIPIVFFINAGFVPKQLYYVTLFFVVVFFISKGSDS